MTKELQTLIANALEDVVTCTTYTGKCMVQPTNAIETAMHPTSVMTATKEYMAEYGPDMELPKAFRFDTIGRSYVIY